MIGNIRDAVARMDAIQTTITGRAGHASDPGSAPPASFTGLLQQAGRGNGVPAHQHRHDTALTPAAGTRRSGPPPGLEGHGNGQIPLQLLAPITGTDERLWAPAAAAFDHMRHDAARHGINLPVVDAYRTYESQVRLADELGLYSQGGLAAEPGTSQHGWGRALDLDVDDRAVSWLRANAWKYGFVETVPREPWHWEFHPAG